MNEIIKALEARIRDWEKDLSSDTINGASCAILELRKAIELVKEYDQKEKPNE